MIRWFAAGTLLFAASPVVAEEICGPFHVIDQHLSDKFGETLRERGATASGDAVVVLYESNDGNTWTLLRVTPDGKACLVAAGEGWGSEAHETIRPGPNEGM
jgi:hypothetical protein